jgi:hypothetical protein
MLKFVQEHASLYPYFLLSLMQSMPSEFGALFETDSSILKSCVTEKAQSALFAQSCKENPAMLHAQITESVLVIQVQVILHATCTSHYTFVLCFFRKTCSKMKAMHHKNQHWFQSCCPQLTQT